MKLKFKDITPGIYPAKITDVVEEYGPYGLFLRFSFTIINGDLKDWSFYGIVKPNIFKQAKFYRWMTIILDKEPPNDEFVLSQIIGKECSIVLERRIKGEKVYYSVKELVKANTQKQS
jgi:hypothetical protein